MYMYFEGIERGFVLVDDKNNQNFKVFLEVYGETFTKDDIAPYIERLEAIQQYKQEFLDARKMVKRHPLCKDNACKKAMSCHMREACWNVGKGRIKI